MSLDRESLRSGRLEAIAAAAERRGQFRRMSPAARAASLAAVLAALPGDPWVFGYGSLMWNPAFHFVERRVALIHGYHRRFCLWTTLGRGTPERPGLMLGLEPGGSCRGVAYRIAGEIARDELTILWSREMIGGAYRPRLVKAKTDRGAVRAIAFVIERGHERYAGRLPATRIAEVIAGAAGELGHCRDYLFDTVAHLEALGLAEGPMHALAAMVRARTGREKRQ